MSTTTAARVLPRERAPDLDLALVDGGRLVLSELAPERFTMLVFNRGLHCPVCHAQLAELDRRLDELAERGIEAFSVSGEDEQRATRMRDDWGLANIAIAYGLTEDAMRAWGLFVSRSISDEEPATFNEPALFLIDPDQTVYYEAILSMPVGRPRLDDLLEGVDFWTETQYPARGEA